MCGTSEQDELLCDQLYEGTEDIFKVLWHVCLTYKGGTREALDQAVAEGGSVYKYLVRCLLSMNLEWTGRFHESLAVIPHRRVREESPLTATYIA